MTVIVYRDNVLVADTRTINGDLINPTSTRKLFSLPDNGIAAIWGPLHDSYRLVTWRTGQGRDGPPPSDIDADARMLTIGRDLKLTVYEGSHPMVEAPAEFRAFGSGSCAALGALYNGATAINAARIATKVDPNSGGLFTIARLRDSWGPAARWEIQEELSV